MRRLILFFFIVFGLSHQISNAGAISPVSLRCEYLVNPLGIDERIPRLNWKVTSDEQAQVQSAYQIQVASSKEILNENRADLWDTGKVQSDQTLHIEYDGKSLDSRQQCFWKVKVWDGNDKPSDWSEINFWSMGLLENSDWTAKYISYRDETPFHKDRNSLFLPAARYYRKNFTTEKQVKKATVYATALGIYELQINGQKVSDNYFAPGWTDYRKRAYYSTYDVTDVVQAGENAIGGVVAEGWYSGYVAYGLLVGIGTERIGRYTYGKTPALMAQLEIEYADGTRQMVATDTSWKVTDQGPIQEADLLMGEFYDARKEMKGWSESGFDDLRWAHSILAQENGNPVANFYSAEKADGSGKTPQIVGKPKEFGFVHPKLEAYPGNPVRVIEEIAPIEITKLDEGKYLFNLGQNFAGTIRLRLQGPEGHRVQIRYGEMLYPDGQLMTANLRKARATDYYICRGDDSLETYSPRFTFHGFQYVEVSNFPGTPDQQTVTGLVLHSDTPLTSTFECSDPMVNQLFRNVVWTQRANFVDLPTDCPQRDERMGWTGDAQIYVKTATYNADVSAFYTKWLRELMESQRPSGTFPGFAPFPFHRAWDFGTAWADAGIICPWTIWQAYGDERLIQRCWEPMTKFMQWRMKTSRHDLGVNHGNGWGDWLTQESKTPIDYIDTIYLAITSRMMSEMAEAIGHADQAKVYQHQFQRTKLAFAKKYLLPDGRLRVKTQTAYALALFAELVPQEHRTATGQYLAKMIEMRGQRMATGFLGTRPLLPVLSSAGQHDLAAFLLQSHEFPSWGYEIEQGATSIWERWDSYTREDGFGRHNAGMNSFAHYSFGAVCEWMFETLAGISSEGPGYQRIRIKPTPPSPGSNAQHEPIHWINASYDSIRGRVVSNWKLENSQFQLHVEIPANTTAHVYLPTSKSDSITVNHQSLQANREITAKSSDHQYVILQVPSGVYDFSAKSNIHMAKRALKTSEPIDQSVNPDQLSLKGKKKLVEWDFRESRTQSEWSTSKLNWKPSTGLPVLVSTGNDPQMVAFVSLPISGEMILALNAKPQAGSKFQVFWATKQKGFHSSQSISRKLNPVSKLNTYLFSINSDHDIMKLRVDPFSAQGQMEIESIQIYQ